MPESIKIGGPPKPSKAPKPGEAKPGERKARTSKGQPRKLGQALGVKEILIFLVAILALLYLYFGIKNHWF
jgi:hypothetical protein